MKSLVLSVCALAALGSFAGTADAAIIDMTVNDNFFLNVTVGNAGFGTPDAMIAVGDTVRWTWATGRTHTVTSQPDDSIFNSGFIAQSGAVFQFTFNAEGDFDYICLLHGFHDPNTGQHNGMAGMISVMAVPTPGAGLALLAAGGLTARRRRR